MNRSANFHNQIGGTFVGVENARTDEFLVELPLYRRGKRIRGFFLPLPLPSCSSTPSVRLVQRDRVPRIFLVSIHGRRVEKLTLATKRILPAALKLDYALLAARLTRLILRGSRIAANIQKSRKRFRR